MRNRVDDGTWFVYEWGAPQRLSETEKASVRRLCEATDLWGLGQCLQWLQGEVWALDDWEPGDWESDRELDIELLEKLIWDERLEVLTAAWELLGSLRGVRADCYEFRPVPRTDRVAQSHPYFHRYGDAPVFNQTEGESLLRLAQSMEVPRLGTCLDWVELGYSLQENLAISLQVLEKLAHHPRETVRLRALSGLDHLDDHPHELWPVVERLASSRMAVRGCLGAFVLEHVLAQEDAFHAYFPRIVEITASGDLRMAGVLNDCYVLGHAEEHVAEIDGLLRKHGIEPLHGRARNEKVICKRKGDTPGAG